MPTVTGGRAIRGGKGWSQRNEGMALVPPLSTAGRLYATKLDKILPVCHYSRLELERILAVDLYTLTTEERATRRLLVHFHDNPFPGRIRQEKQAAAIRENEELAEEAALEAQEAGGPTWSQAMAKVSGAKDAGAGYGWGGVRGVSFARNELVWDDNSNAFVFNSGYAKTTEVMEKRMGAFTSQGRVQGVLSAPFAAARTAVPIPVGAPMKLKLLLS